MVKLNKVDKMAFDRKFRNINILAQTGVSKTLKDVTDDTIEDIKEDAPVDTGALRNSIRGEVRGNTAEIEVAVDYASHVEYGTRNKSAHPFFNKNTRKIGKKLTKELITKFNRT